MKHNRLTTILLITIVIGGIGLNLALHSVKAQLSAYIDDIEQLGAKIQNIEERLTEAEQDTINNHLLIMDTMEYQNKMDLLEEVNETLDRVIREGYNIN